MKIKQKWNFRQNIVELFWNFREYPVSTVLDKLAKFKANKVISN